MLEKETKGIVFNEDCFEGVKKLKDKSVKLFILDPPYTKFYGGDYKTTGGDFKFLEFYFERFAQLIIPKLKDTGSCFIFCDFRTYPGIFNGFINYVTPANLIIWKKNFLGPGVNFRPMHELIVYLPMADAKSPKDRHITDIWEAPRPKDKHHIYQKPKELIRIAVGNCSDEGDLVVDTFLGSGTTAIVCRELNRRFIGYESNPKHYETSKERIKQIPLFEWTNNY